MNSAADSLGASAVKGGVIFAGTAISWFNASNMGLAVTALTVIYTLLQIIRAIPWITGYCRAFIHGVRGDWSDWWKIAERPDNGDSQ